MRHRFEIAAIRGKMKMSVREEHAMANDLCNRCGHPFDPHILACTLYCRVGDSDHDTPAGGYMFCPVAGCSCEGTWSIPDHVAGFDVSKRLAELPKLSEEDIRRLRGH